MLWNYQLECCSGLVLLSLILWACAGYAKHVNAKREADDPYKKQFEPAAVHLTPITGPLLIVLGIVFFVPKALAYGIFLVFFVFTLFTLFAIRKLIPWRWLKRMAERIGEKLLEANTLLIRSLFREKEDRLRPPLEEMFHSLSSR